MFIQVNTITDIQDYNLEEIKYMLSAIASKDGEILGVETSKIINNNAIEFRILSEDRLINSQYIIIGNNLYNLIFTGTEADMKEVGEEIFDSVINSLEF